MVAMVHLNPMMAVGFRPLHLRVISSLIGNDSLCLWRMQQPLIDAGEFVKFLFLSFLSDSWLAIIAAAAQPHMNMVSRTRTARGLICRWVLYNLKKCTECGGQRSW